MTPQILTTKLCVPPLSKIHCKRPRLTSKLDAAATRKLTVVCAPAGYGKTTLLVEWIAQRERPVAWLSLDRTDNEIDYFLHYLAAVCPTEQNRTFHKQPQLFKSAQLDPPHSELVPLINHIASLKTPFDLVLDNYQVIENESIHEIVAMLLDNLTDHLHLLIASRSSPALPLARLHAREELSELRTMDLRFTPEETRFFFRETNHYDLPAKQVAKLYARTEGWIEGLRIAAILLRDLDGVEHQSFIDGFAGSNRHVADYLTEEVLEQQPENLQLFLLQVSILDQLNESLCRTVAGETQTQDLLERLEAVNAFLEPLDTYREWYRFHQLFAEFLQQRLRQTYPDRVSVLHRRASDWYAKQGMYNKAIRHALDAYDWEEVMHLIDSSAESMRVRNQLANTEYKQLADSTDSKESAQAFEHYIYSDLNALSRGRELMSMGEAKKAEEALSQIDLSGHRNGGMSERFALINTLGQIRITQGKLRLAAATYQPLKNIATAQPSTPSLLSYCRGLFSLCYEWNQLEKAEEHLQLFLNKAMQSDRQPLWILDGLLDLAHCRWSQGRQEASHQALQQAVTLAKESGDPSSLSKVRTVKSHLALRENKIEQAVSWASSFGPDPEHLDNYDVQLEFMVLARVFARQGRSEKALPILNTLLTKAMEHGRDGDVIKLLVQLSLAYQAQEESDRSFAAIAQAVCLAEQEGFIRTFIDEGQPMIMLLQQIAKSGIAHLYVNDLLSRFDRTSLETRELSSQRVVSRMPVEQLSPRETEVLSLVAAGSSNQDIATSLNIAISTVKKHVGNILGKLQVKNRTEAAALAREYNLI